jgi:signal transduction histidine kinase
MTRATLTTQIPGLTGQHKPMRWDLSKLSPRLGTAIFALAFFAIRIGTDWLFRWFIADAPMPPLWTVLITTGIGTAISSVLVYLLLASVQRQFRAVRLLNHELRNSLQVLTYAVSNLEPRIATAARDAIDRLLRALRQASDLLREGATWS